MMILDCPWWCTASHRTPLPAHRQVAGEFVRPNESLAIEVVQEPDATRPTITLSHYVAGAPPLFTNLTLAEIRTLHTATAAALAVAERTP